MCALATVLPIAAVARRGRQEDPDVDEPRVAAEMQAGYRIGDKLLRASRVVVAVPPEEN